MLKRRNSDEEGSILEIWNIDASSVSDNTYVSFSLSNKISDSKDRVFYLMITSDSVPGSAITVYTTNYGGSKGLSSEVGDMDVSVCHTLEYELPASLETASVKSQEISKPGFSQKYSLDKTAPLANSFNWKDTSKEPAGDETVEAISFIPNEEKKKIRLIGNVFKTYILLEYDDQLVMIDQHAAHERLNYDAMMKAYDLHRAGQELLVPIIVKVTPKEQNILEEYKNLLEQLGLIVEPFGENEVAIRSIPMILGQPQTQAFFRDMLDELAGEPHGFTLEKRRTAILQTACKHSVKGGEALSEEDMRYLVEQLIDQHVTPTCPHGRPLVVSLSHTELDRKFRRIQPD